MLGRETDVKFSFKHVDFGVVGGHVKSDARV